MLFLILSCSLPLLGSELPERYRKWLEEEVVYIITPKEKDVFLKLKTDRERDIFIEAFWKQRDSTPNTPRNEFREEHYRRLNYANQYLGRGTGKPGWKTDQGRIYIILGPPNNIDKYENIMGVYPAQIWFYYGDPKYGLPTGFNVIFFKKDGIGEYVLYSPSDHGPQALVADYMYNARDARDAYQKLYELSPNLAEQSLSLIPEERMEPGVINLASNRLLATIFSIPQRQVEDAYAEAWLKYKDLIEVEYSTNYIRADFEVWTVRDASGNYLVHYSVEPAKVSVQEDNQGYLVNFDLNGRVSDEQGRTIYQFEKSLPLVLDREQLAEIRKRAVSFQDVFPLIPGSYNFDLLVKNPLSREFSSFSQKIHLPVRTDSPEISQILLAHDFQEIKEPLAVTPFKIGTRQILTQSRKSFAPSESLVACLQVTGLDQEMTEKAALKLVLFRENQPVLSLERKLENLFAGSFFIETIPLASFVPGYYTLTVDLMIDGQVKDTRREDLEISALPVIPRPIVVSRANINVDEEMFVTGLQLLNTGNSAEAAKRLALAYAKNPGLKQAVAYGEALFRTGDYEKVIDLLKTFDQPEAPAEVVSLLGRSYHSLNQFAQASVYYEQYLSRFGVSFEVLNYLGTCYYQLGDKEKALSAWEKSLTLNPNQDKLRELVNSIKKNKGN
jgi:GWxTD domain-containing protein